MSINLCTEQNLKSVKMCKAILLELEYTMEGRLVGTLNLVLVLVFGSYYVNILLALPFSPKNNQNVFTSLGFRSSVA